MKSIYPFFLLLLLFSTTVRAQQPVDAAAEAYKRGDCQTALSLWRASAEQGEPVAQANVGNLYYGGKGVTQDYAEALQWYHMSADQGWAKARWVIGGMYENGRGVKQDKVEAYFWYVLAMRNLDKHMRDIYGTEESNTMENSYHNMRQQLTPLQIGEVEDMAEAYTKAQAGDPDEEGKIAEAYANGNGVNQDNQEATFWFAIGGLRKPDYKSHREETERSLTKDQIAAVERRIAVWQKTHHTLASKP